MKKTIGGHRLGGGANMETDLRTYNRSSHNLGYTWRSTMASGTLVPFMKELALPGDSFDIDLQCEVLTHPTVGPLFGSFKVQLDVFVCPIRLYQAELHQNMSGIGNKMQTVHIPQVRIESASPVFYPAEDSGITLDNYQINGSCILSYLDIRGVGVSFVPDSEPANWIVKRDFNAVPWLAYWDIYKNYYANQQEEVGYVIHTSVEPTTIGVDKCNFNVPASNDIGVLSLWDGISTVEQAYFYGEGCTVIFQMDTTPLPDVFNIERLGFGYRVSPGTPEITGRVKASDVFESIQIDRAGGKIHCSGLKVNPNFGFSTWNIYGYTYNNGGILNSGMPELLQFDLANIDTMKQRLLRANYGVPYVIDSNENLPPYSSLLGKKDALGLYATMQNQEGLGLKTYQSDLFNNWVNTEWIDGDNGINAITAVSTAGGEFSIDSLMFSKKLYAMLMNIAVSGGTYDDWIQAVYTEKGTGRFEMPMYVGGLSKELTFQEVISNSGTEGEPLGTLAGRGVMTNKNKGGNIKIRIEEPSYILGIVSLTPRLDYSQGNKWDVNLKTMADLHAPEMDQIGFQDLLTDQLAWWDTRIFNELGGEVVFRSAGKQPAWINYMTNVDVVRGNFTDVNNQMYMVLNRRYEPNGVHITETGQERYEVNIKDLTTYIDPAKFNYIFAQTSRDAQNFWTQIKVDIFARRRMSARMMPNP